MNTTSVTTQTSNSDNTLKTALFADMSTTFVRNVLTPVLQKFSAEGKLQGDVDTLVEEAVVHLGATPAKVQPVPMMGGAPMPMANPMALAGPPQLAGTGSTVGRKAAGGKVSYPDKANPPPQTQCQRYKTGRNVTNTGYCAKKLNLADPKENFTKYCKSCVKLQCSEKDFKAKYGEDWLAQAMSGAPAPAATVPSMGAAPPLLGQPMLQQPVVTEEPEGELSVSQLESGNYVGKFFVDAKGWPRFFGDLVGEGEEQSLLIKGIHDVTTDSIRPCNGTELALATKYGLTVDQTTPTQVQAPVQVQAVQQAVPQLPQAGNAVQLPQVNQPVGNAVQLPQVDLQAGNAVQLPQVNQQAAQPINVN